MPEFDMSDYDAMPDFQKQVYEMLAIQNLKSIGYTDEKAREPETLKIAIRAEIDANKIKRDMRR